MLRAVTYQAGSSKSPDLQIVLLIWYRRRRRRREEEEELHFKRVELDLNIVKWTILAFKPQYVYNSVIMVFLLAENEIESLENSLVVFKTMVD